MEQDEEQNSSKADERDNGDVEMSDKIEEEKIGNLQLPIVSNQCNLINGNLETLAPTGLDKPIELIKLEN